MTTEAGTNTALGPTAAPGGMGLLGDAARALAVAGVLMSANVHLDLWINGYRDIRIIGPLFLLNAAGGLIIGVTALMWRHPLTALAAAGFGAATLAAFWLSVTVGLFGVHESASGTPQVLAEGAEIGAVVFGVTAAWVIRCVRRVR